jgi:hypothetical protein
MFHIWDVLGCILKLETGYPDLHIPWSLQVHEEHLQQAVTTSFHIPPNLSLTIILSYDAI